MNWASWWNAYGRVALLLSTYAVAMGVLYAGIVNPEVHAWIIGRGYVGTFVAGLLYAYGLSSAVATAVLLVLAQEQNVFLAAFVAGVGALISDLVIFWLVRRVLDGERAYLSGSARIGRMVGAVPGRLRTLVAVFVASVLISSPLPTEFGVAILATVRRLHVDQFAVVAYVLHTAGIVVILLIGSAA